MLTFVDKVYLLLFLPLLCYVVWYFSLYKKNEPSLVVANVRPYRSHGSSWRTRLLHVPFFLRLFIFSMLILVLARPQTANSWKDTEVEGIDIMLAIDISTSMLAEDLKPNRVEAARTVATEFVSGRPNDNIGLTVFAAEAFTQCPMTTDHKVLLNLFKGVNCDLVLGGLIENGTAIGMGISNAASRLKESKAKSKVIILLTDGSNNKGEISPFTAADIAKAYGIRIYTIAVGTEGVAPVPYPLPGGGFHYVNMPVDIDAKTLEQIAHTTNGQFYRATNNKQLQQIYKDIDKLEKTKFTTKRYDKRYEAYEPFAWAAFVSLLLELLLSLTLLRRIP